MGADRETLAFYTAEAQTYAAGVDVAMAKTELRTFIEGLPAGGPVLDFGCGSGWAANHFGLNGFDVQAYDGSTGLAAQARSRYGIDVTVGPFEDFGAQNAFDGIWASFCLLHDTRDAMPGHLARLHEALRPGGLLYVGLKEGTGSERDTLGRLYTYYTGPEISGLLCEAGFLAPSISTRVEAGFSGKSEPCLHIFARRG